MPLQQRETDSQKGMMKMLTMLIHIDRTQGRHVWHTWIQGIIHLDELVGKTERGETQLQGEAEKNLSIAPEAERL